MRRHVLQRAMYTSVAALVTHSLTQSGEHTHRCCQPPAYLRFKKTAFPSQVGKQDRTLPFCIPSDPVCTNCQHFIPSPLTTPGPLCFFSADRCCCRLALRGWLSKWATVALIIVFYKDIKWRPCVNFLFVCVHNQWPAQRSIEENTYGQDETFLVRKDWLNKKIITSPCNVIDKHWMNLSSPFNNIRLWMRFSHVNTVFSWWR